MNEEVFVIGLIFFLTTIIIFYLKANYIDILYVRYSDANLLQLCSWNYRVFTRLKCFKYKLELNSRMQQKRRDFADSRQFWKKMVSTLFVDSLRWFIPTTLIILFSIKQKRRKDMRDKKPKWQTNSKSKHYNNFVSQLGYFKSFRK